MVTDRDIDCCGVAGDLDPANTPVHQVMTEQVVWCFDDLDVKSAASLMEEHGVHRFPVINRNKRMVGILSLVDDLAARGILIRSPAMRGVAEEVPGVYKDVGSVVNATERAGLAHKVARLTPSICIKG